MRSGNGQRVNEYLIKSILSPPGGGEIFANPSHSGKVCLHAYLDMGGCCGEYWGMNVCKPMSTGLVADTKTKLYQGLNSVTKK